MEERNAIQAKPSQRDPQRCQTDGANRMFRTQALRSEPSSNTQNVARAVTRKQGDKAIEKSTPSVRTSAQTRARKFKRTPIDLEATRDGSVASLPSAKSINQRKFIAKMPPPIEAESEEGQICCFFYDKNDSRAKLALKITCLLILLPLTIAIVVIRFLWFIILQPCFLAICPEGISGCTRSAREFINQVIACFCPCLRRDGSCSDCCCCRMKGVCIPSQNCNCNDCCQMDCHSCGSALKSICCCWSNLANDGGNISCGHCNCTGEDGYCVGICVTICQVISCSCICAAS